MSCTPPTLRSVRKLAPGYTAAKHWLALVACCWAARVSTNGAPPREYVDDLIALWCDDGAARCLRGLYRVRRRVRPPAVVAGRMLPMGYLQPRPPAVVAVCGPPVKTLLRNLASTNKWVSCAKNTWQPRLLRVCPGAEHTYRASLERLLALWRWSSRPRTLQVGGLALVSGPGEYALCCAGLARAGRCTLPGRPDLDLCGRARAQTVNTGRTSPPRHPVRPAVRHFSCGRAIDSVQRRMAAVGHARVFHGRMRHFRRQVAGAFAHQAYAL